ncbi:hypothetical protein B9T07_09530 [Limnospira fusiformis CCALA 023]|nr:hypothetical protein NIES39_C02740 [Arthrospira platensis NIES-39]
MPYFGDAKDFDLKLATCDRELGAYYARRLLIHLGTPKGFYHQTSCFQPPIVGVFSSPFQIQ